MTYPELKCGQTAIHVRIELRSWEPAKLLGCEHPRFRGYRCVGILKMERVVLFSSAHIEATLLFEKEKSHGVQETDD